MGKQQNHKKHYKPKKSYEKEEKFSFNDWRWYAANEQLLKDAASIPFSNSLGVKANPMADTTHTTPNADVVAGIAVLEMAPTCGSATSTNSAVNIAARNINSWVRHANSGSRNYESSDLMMNILASSSVFTYISFLERLYGIAKTYSQSNRYLAKALLSAQVGDTIADSIIENLADFRKAINVAIVKASTMCVPQGLSIIDRHIWLNGTLWSDGTNDKHQIYVPMLKYYYIYVPNKYTTGGSLEYTTFSTVGTYTTLFITLNNMMDVLIRDDDINLEWGDIVKAYGDGGLIKLQSVPEDYTILPVYSEEVLSQINNADVLNFDFVQSYGSNLDAVVQYNNVLYAPTELYFSSNYSAFGGSPVMATPAIMSEFDGKYFSIRKDHPDPKDIMVASRLCIGYDGDDLSYLVGTSGVLRNTDFDTAGTGVFDSYTYGSEIVLTCSVITLNQSTLGATQYTSFGTYIETSSNIPVPLTKLTVFDWHPLIMCCIDNQNGGFFQFEGVIGDLQNYTILRFKNLKDINNCAILNEFAVPQLGTVR